MYGLVLMGAGKLLVEGFDITSDEIRDVGHPLVQQGIDQLLKKQKQIGFTDQVLVEKAERHVMEAASWIAKDLSGKKLASANIKHALHLRVGRLSGNDRYEAKEFFPDKDGYE